jgi:hypothetical protein
MNMEQAHTSQNDMMFRYNVLTEYLKGRNRLKFLNLEQSENTVDSMSPDPMVLCLPNASIFVPFPNYTDENNKSIQSFQVN